MKEIIIVGAGGFGRELLQWIKDINKIKKTWIIKGFIDDNLNALDKYKVDTPIIGTISDWIPKPEEVFAIALGSPDLKRRIVSILKSKSANFVSIIHPTALLSEYSKYGEGLIMFPYSKLSCNSEVGDFVTILSSMIGHDTIIGDFTVVSGGCNIIRDVVIGKNVFISAGVSIAQGISIGDDSFIGLGSVVINNVNANSKVFGNPSRSVPIIKGVN